jgi:hypothetical protein
MPNQYMTDWAQAQHDADGGFAATLAAGHAKIAADLRDHAGDLMPVAADQYLFATQGTDDDRRAAVDAWAADHHVTAGWDDRFGYHAKVMFGPMSEVAMVVRERNAEHMAPYLAERRAAIQAAADETLAVTQPDRAA